MDSHSRPNQKGPIPTSPKALLNLQKALLLFQKALL